jgi:hypothetical protein
MPPTSTVLGDVLEAAQGCKDINTKLRQQVFEIGQEQADATLHGEEQGMSTYASVSCHVGGPAGACEILVAFCLGKCYVSQHSAVYHLIH